MKRRVSVVISRMLVIAAMGAILAMGASAQTETILYTFTGTDEGLPQAGLTFDSKGNLYGTTEASGANYGGAVFELSPGSNGVWNEQILYSFAYGVGDGFGPYGNVVFDSKGNLYGTTAFGGTAGAGQGTVFQLVPGSNGVWTENILHNFIGGNDGTTPFSGVIIDAEGNLYGETNGGGEFGWGIVFQLVPGSNGTWTENILHSFANENDGSPVFGSSLVLDGAGNVYGVASGGPDDYGVVFELVHNPNGIWTDKALYAFTGGSDGSGPIGGLVFDGAGNLYGASPYSVFELTPGSNGTWTEKALYTFKGGTDGAIPEAALIYDSSNGNLYGTTNTGGLHRGTVFGLSPRSDGAWTEKILHRFSPSGADGILPGRGSLVVDAKGNLYGMTPGGGASGEGVVFEVTP
jgi:uncharacterized repeat protein (TIGR03803 family)